MYVDYIDLIIYWNVLNKNIYFVYVIYYLVVEILKLFKYECD